MGWRGRVGRMLGAVWVYGVTPAPQGSFLPPPYYDRSHLTWVTLSGAAGLWLSVTMATTGNPGDQGREQGKGNLGDTGVMRKTICQTWKYTGYEMALMTLISLWEPRYKLVSIAAILRFWPITAIMMLKFWSRLLGTTAFRSHFVN